MLIGTHDCTIDIKGRLNFPAKLRDDMGDRFVLCKGFGDKCINAFSLEEWDTKREKIKSFPASKSKELQRYLFPSAAEAEPDKQGRIVIPQALKEFAGLSKDVVIIGSDDHCEIWDRNEWERICSAMETESIGELMETLGF